MSELHNSIPKKTEVQKRNLYTGELFKVDMTPLRTREKEKIMNVVRDPFEPTRYNQESLVKIVNDPRGPLQGAEGAKNVINAMASDTMDIVTFAPNGSPIFEKRSWDGANIFVLEKEGVTTKQHIVESLLAGSYSEEEKTIQGKQYVCLEVSIKDGQKEKKEYLLVKKEERYKLENYVNSKKDFKTQLSPHAQGSVQSFRTEVEKDTAPTPTTKVSPASTDVIPEKDERKVIDISTRVAHHVPPIQREISTPIQAIQKTFPMEKNTIETDMVQENVEEAAQSLLQTTSPLDDEVVKNVMQDQKNIRTRRMTAFLYKGWKLLVGNRGKEQAVYERLKTAYVETVENLFPSRSKETMKSVAQQTWKKTKQAIIQMGEKFTTFAQKKVMPFVAPVKPSNAEVSSSRMLQNGQWVERMPKTPIADFTKKLEEVQGRATTATSATSSPAPITNIRDRQEQRAQAPKMMQQKFTEKTVPSSSAPVDFTAKLKEKAKGLFGKVTSFFKKAA